VEFYVKKNKIVKTIESPRDLLVPDEVTQYSFSYAPHSEIRDILLLSRPDYTIYDEVRNQEDFILFKDLRLTGI
jgi:ATPase